MTKRSPTAAALAQPQYRQRVVLNDRQRRIAEAETLALHAEFDALALLSADHAANADWYAAEWNTRQADQWMPPARQMEG